MYTKEEAERLHREGEECSNEPFIKGKAIISKRLQRKLKTREYRTAQVLVRDEDAPENEQGRKPLKAIQDEGRKSKVARMDSDTNKEFWDLWKTAAGLYAPLWHDRFPQYFDKWIQGENGQIIKYEKGDFFLKHNDGGNFNYDFQMYDEDVCRVLMVAVGLNEEYEGGELRFPCMGDEGTFRLTTGDILCFPAAMQHEVTEVTAGTRYVLIGQYYAPLSPTHRSLYVDQFDRG